MEEEDLNIKTLQTAAEKVDYATNSTTNKKTLVNTLKLFFEKDGRISEAWLFGSFARGEDNFKSDIDLMVNFFDDKKVSLFGIAEICYLLEQQTNRKIDLVEKGFLHEFAWRTAEKDLIKIYG
jgi:hypothetical protein